MRKLIMPVLRAACFPLVVVFNALFLKWVPKASWQLSSNPAPYPFIGTQCASLSTPLPDEKTFGEQIGIL